MSATGRTNFILFCECGILCRLVHRQTASLKERSECQRKTCSKRVFQCCWPFRRDQSHSMQSSLGTRLMPARTCWHTVRYLKFSQSFGIGHCRRLVSTYSRFGEAYCLLLQGSPETLQPMGVALHATGIFINTAVTVSLGGLVY